MRIRTRPVVRRALFATTAVIGIVMTVASPASAAHDDSFSVSTTDGCGAVDFVDYGPGAPGGGNNDDYVVIHDYCGDTHGVMAYVWYNNASLWHKYNGNSLSGAAVVWDPFHEFGIDPVAQDTVKIRVCLVDGADDTTGS